MRVSLWLAGISVAASVIAAVAGGCSSSSATPTANADAGPEDAADDTGTPTTCYVDASLTVFASSDASAAGCAACVQANCATAIVTCATDCTCINLFTCLADSGVATSSLGASAASAVTACAGNNAVALLKNPGVKGLVACLQGTCANACSVVLDGSVATGDDAGTADGAASEAASPADASDDGG